MYAAWLLVFGFEWASGGTTPLDMWLRSVGFGAAMFLILSLTPILVKWVLVGRWKPGLIPIWSMGYLRFWAVKTLTRANPLALFAGSPIYVLYLRLLGAKIGKGVVIFSRTVPVCTDLLTIGDNTVIHKNSFLLCYRARPGVLEKGPVTLGSNVLVSEKTTFDIGTSMGDDSQLGHASALQTGQAVPDGQSWHGSPAERTSTDYRRVPGRALQHPPEGHLQPVPVVQPPRSGPPGRCRRAGSVSAVLPGHRAPAAGRPRVLCRHGGRHAAPVHRRR